MNKITLNIYNRGLAPIKGQNNIILKMGKNKGKLTLKLDSGARDVLGGFNEMKGPMATRDAIGKHIKKEVKAAIMQIPNSRGKGAIKAGEQKAYNSARHYGVGSSEVLKRILYSFTVPCESEPVRFTDQYQTEATAVAHPYNFLSVDLSIGTAIATPIVSNGTGVVFVYRHPARAMIYYNPNSAVGTALYNAYFDNNTTTYQITEAGIATNFQFAPTYWSADSSATFTPHGPKLYNGFDVKSGRSGVWMDVGTSSNKTTMTFTFGTSVSCEFNIYVFDGTVFDLIKSISISSTTTAVFHLSQSGGDYALPGYFAFEFNGVSAATTIAAQLVETGVPSMAHLPINSLVSQEISIGNVRVNAASLLLTNASTVLNRGGEISAAQMPANIYWPNILATNTPFSYIANVNGAVQMRADKGCYAFLKPTKSEDFDFQSVFVTNSQNNLVASAFPLQPTHDYLAMSMTTVQQGTTWPGLSLYMKGCWGIEWRTTSLLFEQIVRPYTTADFELALDMLSRAPQFHENPLHLSDLKRYAGNAVSAVGTGVAAGLKYGPGFLKILRLIAQNVPQAMALLA